MVLAHIELDFGGRMTDDGKGLSFPDKEEPAALKPAEG
jgi:hypothetical protein